MKACVVFKKFVCDSFWSFFVLFLKIIFCRCSIKTPEQWFAERFNAAMKGVGTKEADLVAACKKFSPFPLRFVFFDVLFLQVVLSGSHLKGAAATFKQQFSKDLRAEIAKELTGDLEKVVLAFLDFRLK
jgi:hypothetical protein